MNSPARHRAAQKESRTYDRWYCSPYVNSIAFELMSEIPHSRVEQIRQIAQNEGTVLSRIQGLMLLVTLAALLASALAVSAAMATAIMERRSEVGLMKALGAGNFAVSALFFHGSRTARHLWRPHRLRHRLRFSSADWTLDLQFPHLRPARALPLRDGHFRHRHLRRLRVRHP